MQLEPLRFDALDGLYYEYYRVRDKEDDTRRGQWPQIPLFYQLLEWLGSMQNLRCSCHFRIFRSAILKMLVIGFYVVFKQGDQPHGAMINLRRETHSSNVRRIRSVQRMASNWFRRRNQGCRACLPQQHWGHGSKPRSPSSAKLGHLGQSRQHTTFWKISMVHCPVWLRQLLREDVRESQTEPNPCFQICHTPTYPWVNQSCGRESYPAETDVHCQMDSNHQFQGCGRLGGWYWKE